jgi:hypothetical protein
LKNNDEKQTATEKYVMAIRAGCQDVRAFCVNFVLTIRMRSARERRGQLSFPMAKLLFGVSPIDPLRFMAVALLLTLVAPGASYNPARRAMRPDPMFA